jgi:outer membrane protein, heavy metal efflux system
MTGRIVNGMLVSLLLLAGMVHAEAGETRGRNVPFPEQMTGTLQLEEVLSAALAWNPQLMAQGYQFRAAEDLAQQSRALPNPELAFEMGEVDRDGEMFDAAEWSISLGQAVELGGKRKWRIRQAELEGEIAEWDWQVQRLDVVTQTHQRFARVLANQMRVSLAEATIKVAEGTSDAVEDRVKAGKEPPLQAAKARAELELTRLELLEVENELRSSRKNLAAMWGSEEALFDKVEGEFAELPSGDISLSMLRKKMDLSPEMGRWESEQRLMEAALSSEKAARVPDLDLSAAYNYYREDGTEAMAFGIGLPLPLFNRNAASISAARRSLVQSAEEQHAAEIELAATLSEEHAGLVLAIKRVRALESKVLPAMEDAFEAASIGYRQGKFGFLDMLDAQRGLFEARVTLVDARLDYHNALAEIHRIVGEPMETSTLRKEEGSR